MEKFDSKDGMLTTDEQKTILDAKKNEATALSVIRADKDAFVADMKEYMADVKALKTAGGLTNWDEDPLYIAYNIVKQGHAEFDLPDLNPASNETEARAKEMEWAYQTPEGQEAITKANQELNQLKQTIVSSSGPTPPPETPPQVIAATPTVPEQPKATSETGLEGVGNENKEPKQNTINTVEKVTFPEGLAFSTNNLRVEGDKLVYNIGNQNYIISSFATESVLIKELKPIDLTSTFGKSLKKFFDDNGIAYMGNTIHPITLSYLSMDITNPDHKKKLLSDTECYDMYCTGAKDYMRKKLFEDIKNKPSGFDKKIGGNEVIYKEENDMVTITCGKKPNTIVYNFDIQKNKITQQSNNSSIEKRTELIGVQNERLIVNGLTTNMDKVLEKYKPQAGDIVLFTTDGCGACENYTNQLQQSEIMQGHQILSINVTDAIKAGAGASYLTHPCGLPSPNILYTHSNNTASEFSKGDLIAFVASSRAQDQAMVV